MEAHLFCPMSQRLRKLQNVLGGRFSWYRASPVVYIFQMGKVASTAIKNALLRRRIECYQPHFLSRNAFEQLIKRFEEADLTDWAAENLSGQIAENLRLYNRLIKLQNHSSEMAQKLKIITLTREPLDWYFSNFSQNFGEYRQDVATFVAETRNIRIGNQNEEKIYPYVGEFIHSLLEFASSHMISFSPEESARIGMMLQDAEFSCIPGNRVLLKHCMILLRPFNWFYMHFDPVFNTHIIDSARGNECPSRQLKLDYCEILILRYEDLFTSAVGMLEEFIPECKPLSLKKENRMVRKKTGREVYAVKKDLVLPGPLKRRIDQSPYVQAFYSS